ncbi:MAG: hypothetical protein GXY49_13445 [Syntrophomonadaceae bacterium]|nr:hypothetical protein [Syntrophomonadaceae bacterium]
MKRRIDQAGFIVTEIIMALGLAALVIAALMSIYINTYRVFACQLEFTDIQYAERAAMQMIIEDIMSAREVEYLDDSKKLRLLVGDDYVSYYLQDQTVYRQGAAKMPVANYISSLSFRSDSQPGYTTIHMEVCQGQETTRLVCSAIPRLLIGTAQADTDD